MENNYITRTEHEEFVQRMRTEHEKLEKEDHRQNERIRQLEAEVKENQKINISIERLATSMENMAAEQKRQGDRLKKLEERDGEKWRDVVKYVITTLIGAGLGFLLTHMGL